MIDVLVLSPQEVFFEGRAHGAVFPGELGVFEVLPFHKPFLSRLVSGTVVIGQFRLLIKRGVVQVKSNKVTAIVEK